MATPELLKDLRSGDHNKVPITLGGVPHDRRCLEAADEIERLCQIVRVLNTQSKEA